MAVLEAWTATSTTAWPAQWTPGVNQGTASVASARGRLTPDRAGYRSVRRLLTGLSASSDPRRISGTFILPNVAEAMVYLSPREATGTTDYYPSGYYVRYRPELGTWKIGAGYGTGIYGPDSDTSAGVTLTAAAGDVIGYTVDVSGFTTSARLWNVTAGQTEPAAFQSTWTDTDSAWPSGVPSLAYTSGNTNTSYVEFGQVTDGVTAASPRAGAMMLAF